MDRSKKVMVKSTGSQSAGASQGQNKRKRKKSRNTGTFTKGREDDLANGNMKT